MATATESPFWADTNAQEKILEEMEKALERSGGWWMIQLGPSCLMHGSRVVKSATKCLWGYTLEGYGEAVAEALAPDDDSSDESFCRGLVFRILRVHSKLRKEVLKALLREKLDGVSLEE